MAKAESAWRPRYPYATPHIAWPSAVVVCPGSAGWSTGGAQPAQNRGGTVVSTKYPNPAGARRHQRWQTRVDRLEALGQARAEELTLVASHRDGAEGAIGPWDTQGAVGAEHGRGLRGRQVAG